MIIGAAIAVVLSNTYKKFGRKKEPNKKPDFKNNTFSMLHNCSDCSAECMLRDATKTVRDNNKELCKKIDARQNQSDFSF